jgi:hypothetical protein
LLLWATVSALPLIAQTAQAVVIETLGSTYFSSPNAVAVDSGGNVYVAVQGSSAVVEIVAGTGGAAPGAVNINSTVNTLGSGFSYPVGVAVDSSGNVYVADGNWTVKEIVAGTGGAAPGTVNSNSTVNTLGSGFNYPEGIAVDLRGNVYVADRGHIAVKEIVAGTGGAAPGTVNANSTINTLNGTGVFNNPRCVAVDSGGNVYVADAGNRAVYEMVAGTGTAAPGTVNASSTLKTLGSGFLSPVGVAVDSGGNVYVADQYNNAVYKIVAGTGGAAPGTVNASSTVNTLGSGFRTPTDVAVDSSGDVFVADSGNNLVKEILAPFPIAANGSASNSVFPSTSIGGTSSSVTVTFTFGLGGTLGSTPFAVLTQGAQNLDFQTAATQASDVCITAHTYNTGDSCTVSVVFVPSRPGQRIGAVQLLDSKGAPFSTYHLSGTGTGPMAVFQSNSSVKTLGSGFLSPVGVAVDSVGNVYVADQNNGGAGVVYEVIAGTGAVNTLSGGKYNYSLQSVAVDSVGNVYFVDGYNEIVREIVAGTGTAAPGTVNASSTVVALNNYGVFGTPMGLAVDSSGNIFVADYGKNAVKEIVAGTGGAPAGTVNYNSTVITAGSGFNSPTGVAVDAIGNVYVADYYNNALKKIVAGTGGAAPGTVNASSTVISLGVFSYNQIVTVDSVGDVYAADGNTLKELVAGTGGAAPGTVNSNSTVITLSSPANNIGYSSIAVDARGDVYVGDFNNHLVYELPFATPPVVNFTTATTVGSTDTADGPKMVTLANNGNAPLTFPIPTTSGAQNPSISQDFTLSGSSSCPQIGSSAFSAGTLAAGASCTLMVNFTPTASGIIRGSLVLTDTSLNANPPITQTITLNGTGGSASVPGAPTNVTATAGNKFAVVNFTAPASNGGAAITGYSVVSSPGDLTVTCAAPPCSLSGLTNGTTYTFTVSAINSAGTSAPSAASNPVTPIASQTITFNNPGTQAFGSSPTLTATASSGLAVTFSTGTPQICTITSGGQLTFITVGTCTINANQAGNSAYSVAPQVSQSFTVTNATASITISNLSVTYDGIAHTTAAITNPVGLGVSYAYNGSPTPPTAAGTYAVIATINDPNYAGKTTGTLIINRATASVTPNAASKTYGGSDPVLTGTLSGFVATDNVAATFTRTAGESVASSPYTVNATLSPAEVLANYFITYNTALFTISKVTPAVTWPAPASISFGTALSVVQLNANSTVPGNFAYSPALGAILTAGPQTLSVTFTPTDASNYSSATSNVQLTVNKAMPVVSITASTGFQLLSDPVTFNVSVAAVSGGSVPTGSITFYDGSTALGTNSLTNGSASYASSSLAVGSHSITATYSGDPNYVATTSLSSVSETIGTASISATGSGASINTSPGGQAVFTLSIAPPSGQTFPQAIQLSLSGLPTGANATFSPNPIPAGSGATTVTLTISVPTTASVRPMRSLFGKDSPPIALGLVLMPFAFRFRKAGRKLQGNNRALLVIVTAIATAFVLAIGLSACGGSSNGGSSGGNTTPRTYPLTLTAIAGTYSQTTTLTLIVK